MGRAFKVKFEKEIVEKSKKYDKEVRSLRIISNWDTWDATWLTNKIYRLAQKHKVNFTIKGKVGSLELIYDFLLGVGQSVAGGLIVVGLQEYLRRKRQKRKKEEPTRPLPPVMAVINGEEEKM